MVFLNLECRSRHQLILNALVLHLTAQIIVNSLLLCRSLNHLFNLDYVLLLVHYYKS
jgi:hypothetical protein